jgi:hypothetical protein
MEELLKFFLAPAVIAALVAAFVALRTNERKVQIESITQERAKWRTSIRTNAREVLKAGAINDLDERKAAFLDLRVAFALNLNPYDSKDVGSSKRFLKLNSSKTLAIFHKSFPTDWLCFSSMTGNERNAKPSLGFIAFSVAPLYARNTMISNVNDARSPS